MSEPQTGTGQRYVEYRAWDKHRELPLHEKRQRILAIEAEAIRDYLQSSAAEKALAEALHDVDAFGPVSDAYNRQQARAILKAWQP